jgi:hypothetical protein
VRRGGQPGRCPGWVPHDVEAHLLDARFREQPLADVGHDHVAGRAAHGRKGQPHRGATAVHADAINQAKVDQVDRHLRVVDLRQRRPDALFQGPRSGMRKRGVKGPRSGVRKRGVKGPRSGVRKRGVKGPRSGVRKRGESHVRTWNFEKLSWKRATISALRGPRARQRLRTASQLQGSLKSQCFSSASNVHGNG